MLEQIAIWIPNNLNPDSQISAIAKHMHAHNRNIIQIDVVAEYHNNFKEYYDQHIKQNEPSTQHFVLKMG